MQASMCLNSGRDPHQFHDSKPLSLLGRGPHILVLSTTSEGERIHQILLQGST